MRERLFKLIHSLRVPGDGERSLGFARSRSLEARKAPASPDRIAESREHRGLASLSLFPPAHLKPQAPRASYRDTHRAHLHCAFTASSNCQIPRIANRIEGRLSLGRRTSAHCHNAHMRSSSSPSLLDAGCARYVPSEKSSVVSVSSFVHLLEGLENTPSNTEATRTSRPISSARHRHSDSSRTWFALGRRRLAVNQLHEGYGRNPPSRCARDCKYPDTAPQVFSKPPRMQEGTFRKECVAEEGRALADRRRPQLPAVENIPKSERYAARLSSGLRNAVSRAVADCAELLLVVRRRRVTSAAAGVEPLRVKI